MREEGKVAGGFEGVWAWSWERQKGEGRDGPAGRSVRTGAAERENNLAEAHGLEVKFRVCRQEGGCWGSSLFCDSSGLTMNRGHLPNEELVEIECFLPARSSRDALSAISAKPCPKLGVMDVALVRGM